MREIEVLLDQPEVGENLSDHVDGRHVWTTPEPVEPAAGAPSPRRWRSSRPQQTGPLTSNFAEAGGFARGHATAPTRPTSSSTSRRCRSSTRGSATRPSTASGCRRACCSRESRGSVRLSLAPTRRPSRSSATTTTRPRTTWRRMIARRCGCCCDIARAARARALLRRRRSPVPESDDDDDLRAHVARHTRTLYHPVGTCAIGTRRRRGAARAGRRGPAGGRRVGDADGPARQHERADDRDRRAAADLVRGRAPETPEVASAAQG